MTECQNYTMGIHSKFEGEGKAAPLPQARADEVGISQQRLIWLDDFFAREIADKRVPGAVVAIARDGKLIHYKPYGQMDPVKGTSMPLNAPVCTRLHDQADGGGRRAYADGKRAPTSTGQAFGLLSGIR